jgi:hypothetical protein
MRQQSNHLAHEIQTLFFQQPLFTPLLIKFILQNDQTFKLPVCAAHLVTNFYKIFLGRFNFFFSLLALEGVIIEPQTEPRSRISLLVNQFSLLTSG